jgi:hypothetical protein
MEWVASKRHMYAEHRLARAIQTLQADINKLCNVASCWIYIGILLGAHSLLHISRIMVNLSVLSLCLRILRLFG